MLVEVEVNERDGAVVFGGSAISNAECLGEKLLCDGSEDSKVRSPTRSQYDVITQRNSAVQGSARKLSISSDWKYLHAKHLAVQRELRARASFLCSMEF